MHVEQGYMQNLQVLVVPLMHFMLWHRQRMETVRQERLTKRCLIAV